MVCRRDWSREGGPAADAAANATGSGQCVRVFKAHLLLTFTRPTHAACAQQMTHTHTHIRCGKTVCTEDPRMGPVCVHCARYLPRTGYIGQGGDLGKMNMTLSDAETYCNSLHACAGITYRTPDTCDDGEIHDVYFKSGT